MARRIVPLLLILMSFSGCSGSQSGSMPLAPTPDPSMEIARSVAATVDRQDELRRYVAATIAAMPSVTPLPTWTTSPSATPPAGETPFAVVRNGVANLRSGPGTVYSPVGQVRASAPVGITGRNAGDTWLQVCCVAGQAGWLAAELLDVHGSLDHQPVLTPPSPPEPPLAAAATPSAAPGNRVCVQGQVRDTRGGAPLSGWTIMMRPTPAERAATDSARSLLTDDNGAYQFDDLAPGAYDFEENVPAGWGNVSPRHSTLSVAAADACVSLDFWNERQAKSDPAAPLR